MPIKPISASIYPSWYCRPNWVCTRTRNKTGGWSGAAAPCPLLTQTCPLSSLPNFADLATEIKSSCPRVAPQNLSPSKGLFPALHLIFFFPLLSSLKRAWHLSACRHLIGLDWRRPSGDGLCADKKLLQLIQNLMICRSRTVRIILLSSSAWFGRGGAVWRISLQALMSTCLMNSPTVRTPGTPASPALDLFFHL